MIDYELRKDAEYYRMLYRLNLCTREDAKIHIIPYLERANEISIELSKKFNQRPKVMRFSSYVR